ncbi:hypothetical protein A2U01_0053815, partial [Trifolium medium]|nr:hypothetical protein [Trifolium medium]
GLRIVDQQMLEEVEKNMSKIKGEKYAAREIRGLQEDLSLLKGKKIVKRTRSQELLCGQQKGE